MALKPLISDCCVGKPETCLRASAGFDALGKMENSSSTIYDMKRKYMAQACRLGDGESCQQFYFHTGYENYREHELYQQECDVNDADMPAVLPPPDFG